MTSTIENTDIDLTVLFDFDSEIACESITGCDNEAKWKVVTNCCKVSCLLCDECKVKTIKELDKIIFVKCGHCNEVMFADKWVEWTAL